MTGEQTTLLALVRTAASDTVMAIPSCDESKLLALCGEHGVTPLALAAIDRIRKERDVKTFGTETVLRVYAAVRRQGIAMERLWRLAEEFIGKVGLPCVVLKGPDYCRFWPTPEWRGFCDLDIWAMGDYRLLNEKAQDLGCKVHAGGYYKHSEISYKGLLIENHQWLTTHDDTFGGRLIEKALRTLLTEGDKNPLKSGGLSPCREFTALYILTHAHQHFFWEGFSLKIILDWLFFLKKEGARVDWTRVVPVLEKAGVKGFCDVITAFCERHLGLPHMDFTGKTDLLDAFTEAVFEEPAGGNRMSQLLHRFNRMSRFRPFLGSSVFVRVKNTLVYNYLHKTPELGGF